MYAHTDHAITIDGLESRVHIIHGPGVTHAHGIAFDEDAAIIGETDTQRYVGYCDAEIVGRITADMLGSIREIEWEELDAALDLAGLTCDCEDSE